MVNLFDNSSIIVYILAFLVIYIFIKFFTNKAKSNKIKDIKYNDKDKKCFQWAYNSECLFNPDFMLENCKSSCGMNGIPLKYINTIKKNYSDFIKNNSKDNNNKCSKLAKMGECEGNPNYMLTECKKSCANNWNLGYLYNQKKSLN